MYVKQPEEKTLWYQFDSIIVLKKIKNPDPDA
jgi:hypothetical protein